MSETACHERVGSNWLVRCGDRMMLKPEEWTTCPTCSAGLRSDGTEQRMMPAVTSSEVREATRELEEWLYYVDEMEGFRPETEWFSTILAARAAAAGEPESLSERVRREMAQAGPMDWNKFLEIGRELFADEPEWDDGAGEQSDTELLDKSGAFYSCTGSERRWGWTARTLEAQGYPTFRTLADLAGALRAETVAAPAEPQQQTGPGPDNHHVAGEPE